MHVKLIAQSLQIAADGKLHDNSAKIARLGILGLMSILLRHYKYEMSGRKGG